MFVDVDLEVSLPVAITVPADAIIDTGARKTVYVDRGEGNFEPRRVETGWRLGKQVEIVSGLTAGEKIVVSGNFLIDSESRMRAAAQGIFGSPTKDPVCGMFVDEDKTAATGRTSRYQGKTYFFCSDACKVDFEKDPKKYAETGTKEPESKTKDAMMKELGMQEKKAPAPAMDMGKDEHKH
jgi:YHS domain-containing protein